MNIWRTNVIRQLTLGMPSARYEMAKSYEEAVCALNTLQSNAATIARSLAERDKRRHLSIPDTISHAQRAGVPLSDINNLSMIHVSGTKGKGSTCAFCEKILHSQGFKTGFFSSPHLVEVRERIRINGQPLSKEAFSTYFWDCYKKLEESKSGEDDGMPPYFRFLTIMAFHTFIQEKVDVAIMEVGIGGEYDCTNIISHPVVCGVSSLGLDHTSLLGDTIHKIAWHKAGIFKPGVPAFTVPQPENSEDVLKDRAREIGCPLYLSPTLDDYSWQSERPSLGIPGHMQEQNASLALQLCHTWMKNHKKDPASRATQYRDYAAGMSNSPDHYSVPCEMFDVSEAMAGGLRNTRWPGRSQILPISNNLTYYIDGAHTPRSIEACATWFRSAADKEARNIKGKVIRVLLFNTTGERKPESLLQYLVPCKFDAAVFCPNIASVSKDTTRADQMNLMVTTDTQLLKCTQNRNSWLQLLSNCDIPAKRARHSDHDEEADSDSGIDSARTSPDQEPMPTHTFASIEDALLWAGQGRDPGVAAGSEGGDCPSVPAALRNTVHVQVLCTGSLHLVGGFLGLVDPDLKLSMS